MTAKTVSKRKMKRKYLLVKKRTRPVALVKQDKACNESVAEHHGKASQLQKSKFYYVDSNGVVHTPDYERKPLSRADSSE